jgi:hypothetical protein
VTLCYLLIGSSRLVGIGMRDRAQLRNEQRQPGNDCDAKFNANGRF